MKFWPRICTLLCLGGAVSMAGAAPEPVSVRILQLKHPAWIEAQTPAGSGPWLRVEAGPKGLLADGQPAQEKAFGSLDTLSCLRAAGISRNYKGRISIRLDPDSNRQELLILDQMPLLDYLAGVVAAESENDPSQPSYIKALATVVLSYALSTRGRHTGYDFCDYTHCQLYQGQPREGTPWKKLVEEEGLYRLRGPLDKTGYFFSRCCGGALDSPANVWGKHAGAEDKALLCQWEGRPLCGADRFFHWTTRVSFQDLEETFTRLCSLDKGARLTGFSVQGLTPAGRNRWVVGEFRLANKETRTCRVATQSFLSAFGQRHGWRVFHSALFQPRRGAKGYTVMGQGLGHGTGLCQSGARELARLGKSWREILKFYFPQSQVERVD